MPTCPECKGVGGCEVQISECWEEPPRHEWERCAECGGSGIISPLAMAVYKARGGSAPIQMRGFS